MRRRVVMVWSLIVCGALALQAWALWGERWGVAENRLAGPNAPVGEIAEGIAAEQTFVMRAPGLRAFTFTPRAVGDTVVGDVIFDVYDVTPEGDRPLFRIIRKATSVVRGGRPYTLAFSPIHLPVPRLFKVRIALPDAKLGQGFFIDGVEQDRYPGGLLVVNGAQVWGDLAFDTDAEAARLVGRLAAIGGPYPRFMRSPAVAIGLAVLANLLLGWIAWIAVSAWLGEAPRERRAGHAGAASSVDGAAGLDLDARPERVAPGPARRALRWANAHRVAALTLVVVAAAVVGLAGRRDRVQEDLAATFPSAEKRTSMPTLHEGFSLFEFPTVGVVEPCILALPSSRITWPVDVGASAMLSVRVGLRPDVWEMEGDGVVFRVGIAGRRGYEELRRQQIDPWHYQRDRRYLLWRFDLARFAGQRVNIVFNVEPGPSQHAVNDAALWCAPRLLTP